MAAVGMTTQISAITASSQAIDSSETVITDHRTSFFVKNICVEEVEVPKNTSNSKVKLRSSKQTKALSAIPTSTIRAQSLRSNLPFVQILHTPSVTLARSLSCDEDKCSNSVVTSVGLSTIQRVDNSTQTDTMRNKVKREHNEQKDFWSSKTQKESSMLNEICEKNEGILAIALDRKSKNDSEKNMLEEEKYLLLREMDFLDVKSACIRGSDDTLSETKSLIECDNSFKKPISASEVEQSSINSDNIFESKTHSNSESFLESVECTCNATTQFNCDCGQTLGNCTYQEHIIDYDNFRIIEHVIDCAHESYCEHDENIKCDCHWKDAEEENVDQNKEMNLSCRELVAFIGESYKIVNNEHHSIENQDQPVKNKSVASSLILDTHHSSNVNDEKNIYCSGDVVIDPLLLDSQYANTNLDENLDKNNNKGYSKGVEQIFNGTKNHPSESNLQILTNIATSNSVSTESYAQTEPSKRNKEQSISTIQNSTPSMALALKALKSKLTPLAPSFHPARKKSQPTSYTTNASSSMYAYEQTAIYYQQEPQLPKPQTPCLQQSATTTTAQKMNLHLYPRLQEEQKHQQQVLPLVQPSYSKNYFQHQHHCSSLMQNVQQVQNFVISSTEHPQHGDEFGNLLQSHLNSAHSSATVAFPTSTLPVTVANPTQQAQLYPVHLISMANPTLVADAGSTIGQRQQACSASTVVATVGNGSTPWPLLEAAPVYIDSHGEFHTFCPTHGHAALNTTSVESAANSQCVPFNQPTLNSTRSSISQSLHSKHYQTPRQNQNQTRPQSLITVPVASTKVNTTNHLIVQNTKANNQNHNQNQNHQLCQQQQPQSHYHQQQRLQKFDSGIILNISGKGKLSRATPEQHPPQHNQLQYTNNNSNKNGQQNAGTGALNKNISSSSSSTSSLNSNASSFEPHHNQIHHQFQHQLLHHQHQHHNTSQVRQQRSTNNILMVVPQQQQQQVPQTQPTQQQAQYTHVPSLGSQHQLPQQHSFTHHIHHQNPSQPNGVAMSIQQQQHKQPPPQQSPPEISTSSLPASPPLIQQTSTASQSAQLVQPVCAIHHPQQHQQQFALVAAMHQHLTAAAGLGSLPPQHMHLPHGPQVQQPQTQPQAASLQVQAQTGTSQQSQTTQHSQQLLKENNADSGYSTISGGGGNQASGNNPGASSNESPTSTVSTGTTSVAAQHAPSTPGQLYIQYPADFYPTEYYITPHSHDSMCPQHPHHHQAMCAVSTDYGPATVQMVSQNRPAPITVPVQVPQGQMMQQYVNENGTFAHVVLSPQYQQLHSSQGHMHAPFMQASGSSQFYSTLPAGFAPSPGSGPAHFHTLASGHVQTQQLSQHQKATTQQQQAGSQTLSHSPSPPNSYHKDERTQRQHTKLLRKLEKQREINSAMSTPTHVAPPRRSDLNGYHNLSVNSANSSPVNGAKIHDHVISTSEVSQSNTVNSNSPAKSSSDNGLGVVQSVQNTNKSLVQLKQDTSPLQQPLKKQIFHSQTTQRNGDIVPNVSPSGINYGVNIAVSKEDKGEFNSNVLEVEEVTQALIIEQLSAIQKPSVINLTSRSAKIIWEGPIMTDSHIDTRNLRYNVLLSDRAKDGKYKSLYKGDSYDCIVQDLQPGQMYVVRVQVYYNKMQGTASEASEFKTPPCEPDQPMPPKLVMRTKNSLHLRWSNPPSNGSPIQHYLLEYDDGKCGLFLSTRTSRQNIENEGHNFVEATKTKGKHYTLTKLQPSTVYYFRLAAVNDVGMSLYSTICSYCTSNNPPAAPKPPKLQSSSPTTIRLWWERRQQDGDYVLQILDPDSGHGYLNAYNGPDTSHECCELRRATSYQFRLRAENEAGISPWSNEVTYQTAPEKPGKPGKPHVKGKIHGTYFRARWDPPTDLGGAEIIRYFLEITSGAKFERIYSGTDTESICDRLQPGTTYQLRASCEGPAGVSPYSDVAHITSEALVPSAPSPPYYDSAPGPYAAVLRLDKPESNGGAPILEFEVQMRRSIDDKDAVANKANDYSIVYHGRDTFCVVKDLQPGWPYEVQVRAINRIGAGPWSSWFRFAAAAAPPNVPENLNVVIKSATHLLVNWEEPSNNGAPIQEYRLESLTVENGSDLILENSSKTSAYHTSYCGGQTSIDLRNLSPFTMYYFRVNASNASGVSKWSTSINARTPAAVPAAPQIKDCEFTANEVVFNWSEPECNGACITAYAIECAEKSFTTTDANTTYTINGLMPETTYKIRLQAINSIGFGPFSSYTKFTTLPSPPAPPALECTGVGHNFIKLKWGDGKNLDFTKYYVEMFVQRAKEFQIVYSGTSCMCKVNKLQESTAYTFRVYASTDRAGIGDISDEYIFSTTPTLPSSIKAPRVALEGASACLLTHGGGSANGFIPSGVLPETPTSFIAGIGNLSLGVPLTLEWQNSKNSFNDPVEYVLQYAIGKDGEYRRIYRGSETKFTVENLEPGTMYQFRVYPIRITKSGEDLVGQYTSAFRYQVPHLAALDDIDGNLLGNMGSVFGTSGRGINSSNNGSMSCHGHSHLAHHVHSLHTHHSHSHTLHNSRQSTSNLHHRSVSASAASPNGCNGHISTNINDSSNNSGNTILIGPNAIGLIPLGTSMANELTAVEFAGCEDPLHHHHHHHHHQFFGGNVSPGSDSLSATPTTASFLASNNLLTNNALLVHGIASSNHTQHGVIRRYMSKLTTIYTNRKRFTDQEKAVLFMVCFLFFTFIFATLVKALMR